MSACQAVDFSQSDVGHGKELACPIVNHGPVLII